MCLSPVDNGVVTFCFITQQNQWEKEEGAKVMSSGVGSLSLTVYSQTTGPVGEEDLSVSPPQEHFIL